METWIEKIKEYKLFLGLAAVGLVMGGIFLFWPKQPHKDRKLSFLS